MGSTAREAAPQEPAWTPKSKLGLMVMQGKVSSLYQIFQEGIRIQEPEIVKTLLPDLESEVVGVRVVQKQTDAGELTRFSAVVAVGDRGGWFGVGDAKGPQMRIAIEKATDQALLNIIPVRLGCGSWECRCGRNHSTPFRVEGKCGSVRVVIIPGPRGLGLVAGETAKRLLALAGIRDAWTRTFGSTSTVTSITYAIYDALLKLHTLVRR